MKDEQAAMQVREAVTRAVCREFGASDFAHLEAMRARSLGYDEAWSAPGIPVMFEQGVRRPDGSESGIGESYLIEEDAEVQASAKRHRKALREQNPELVAQADRWEETHSCNL